jgi:hypothetical protein
MTLFERESMDEMDSFAKDAVMARHEGRDDDALRLLKGLFDEVSNGAPRFFGQYFITMLEWSQQAEKYHPAYEALVSARDEQVRRLLSGDEILGAGGDARPHSRFQVIVDMNNTLKDSRATYTLFVQLVSFLPTLARREAFMALPAIVEAGDFALAERYLTDPLERLEELNRMAGDFPLFPPLGAAPRLAAELSNFMKDVVLRAAVLQGLGRETEGESLRKAALAGLESEDMRALGIREIAVPGTIINEITSHQMSLHAAGRAD